MIPFTKSELAAASRETGFVQNSLEKALRLLRVLDRISKHPFLRECFVLKGGTALNLFYFDMPRLSVDADLNYIKNRDKEKMQMDREVVDKIIPEVFGDVYSVTFSKKEYALSQFELRYTTLSNSGDRIKLEINYLHRLLMMSRYDKDVDWFGVGTQFPVLGNEELFAGKIIALLSRYTPRDLFDVYEIALINSGIDTDLLQQLVLYYGLIARESVFELFDYNSDRIREHDIRSHLFPMLTGTDRPELELMKKTVTQFLSPLTTLDNTISGAIKEFYSTGKLHADILFSNARIRDSIEQAPTFEWKRNNILQHQKGNHSK